MSPLLALSVISVLRSSLVAFGAKLTLSRAALGGRYATMIFVIAGITNGAATTNAPVYRSRTFECD